MEQAVYITKTSQLHYANGQYSRVYFGCEFCERLIPSLNQLKRVTAFVRKRKLAFSLVTPYVTREGLTKLKGLFDLLKEEGVVCEIIVNDWGVLNLINREYPFFTPVLGRLMTRQEKGPRLARALKRKGEAWAFSDPKDPKIKRFIVEKEIPLDLDPYYKGANTLSVPILQDFLIKQRVKRIEFDNALQGVIMDVPKDKMKLSVYYPYGYITTTFFCPTAGCDDSPKSVQKIKPCRKQCQKYIFKLRHKTMPKILYLKGNTHFFKNSRLPVKKLQDLGVDRIVYQPDIAV